MTTQNSTNNKIRLSQTDRLVGRSSAGGGLSEEIPCTAIARAILAASSKAGARTAIDLGTASTVNTGTAEGEVPLLIAGGVLPASMIPAISITSIQTVADQAARLALTNVQEGDVVKQTDNGLSYILGTGAASSNASWISIGDTSIDAGEIVSGTLPTARGGTGLSTLGTPLNIIRVNAAGTALEYAAPGNAINRLPYTEETTTTRTIVPDNAYGANHSSKITFTLPTTAGVGSQTEIIGIGAGGWQIVQSAGQQMHFGNLSTTVGPTGRIENTERRDCITLKCIVANTEWVVVSSVGNIDVV